MMHIQDELEAVVYIIEHKLDGVGPFDNRPSADKLHHFIKNKKKLIKNKTTKKFDIWHMTGDMWHVTRDTWHMTCDTL